MRSILAYTRRHAVLVIQEGGLGGGCQQFRTALHWDGTTWSAVNSGTTGNFGSISGTSATDIWTSGSSGLFRWDGSVWAMAAPGSMLAGGDIWAVAPDDVWATTGFANVGHWDGSTWTVTQAAEFTNFGLFAIWADAGSAWSVDQNTNNIMGLNGIEPSAS